MSLDKRNKLLDAAGHYPDFDRKHAVFTGDARIRRAMKRLLAVEGVELPKSEPICWYGDQAFAFLDNQLHRFDMSREIFKRAYEAKSWGLDQEWVRVGGDVFDLNEGELIVKHWMDKCYWSMEWGQEEEIPKSLYDELIKYEEARVKA
jgi:hypothetical protein